MAKKPKSKFYSKIYHIANPDKVSDEQENELLMVGSSNWDHFYEKIFDKLAEEDYEIKNVELLEFDKEDEIFAFLNKLDDNQFIDYSLEHDSPLILKFA